MKAFYDRKKNQWYSLEDLFLGSNSIPLIKVQAPAKNWLQFELRSCNKNAGPIIGILTGKGKKESLAGNGPLFIALQKEVLKNQGITVVFTADNLSEETVKGFLYSPNHNQWVPVTCPLPHIVYNRVPFRKQEAVESFIEAAEFFSKKGIPFFNPGFLDKFNLYNVFNKSNILKTYLPETILNPKKNTLNTFLKQNGKVYLKPALGSKGKGIYLLTFLPNEEVKLEGVKETVVYSHFDEFWEEQKRPLQKKTYIAQKAIEPALNEGHRYDFRILAHYNGNEHILTGVGIRQSQSQEVTTHIPNGGVLIPYKQFQTSTHDEFFRSIVKEVGRILTESHGFFGEFSIDAGISHQGDYYIYEVNSKPMSFDETEIEKKRIHLLSQLFFELSEYE
ncbi:YheC/YheD family endospore coat-associated protein [Cytobacillus purgationiresistens]|uniref:ATP-grasp domain-containing protein n=1 Tax=Cytobacillus purgationiresistens TaxID=863449 RepID=A0ABU0ACJ1_9BACI|nr:YheC/YheD family protein [Cytobacillus purgationiresistens]MDQ0268967.1 hypothetical protein [Cytobacillus purgationiresistens]